MKTRSRRAAMVVLALSGLGLAACSQNSVSGRAIRMDPTPELITLHQRPVDIANEYAFMRNTNHRMILADIRRVFYTDRPSRLTPEPMPR